MTQQNASDTQLPKPWFVYILRCADGTLYTGCTNRLELRVKAHNLGKGAKYTASRTPVKLVFWEEVLNRSAALKRELALKKYSRRQKLTLIRVFAAKRQSR